MKLLSWNVNGVRAVWRKGVLQEWLRRQEADVYCLQETKARPDQLEPEVLNPCGCRGEWHWGEKKGYSGVATFSKTAPEKVERGFGVAEFDNEGRALITRHADLSLFNIYFPNGKRDDARLRFKMDFNESLLGVLERFRKRGDDKIVICGDVNTAHREIDLARPKENREVSGFLPQERAWIDRLLAAGFIDAFREFEKGPAHYSWWDMQSRARERNVGWRIDYFFISANLRPRLKRAFLQPEVMGSDHCPVGIELAP
ncbi:MAG TPA: exodeoxyribonuclease III [Elusimicrobia bacterium]|nr:MAG: exodeoxyribonuclease III [Elusimicrobia bacterium GWA2_66_18]OGR68941.1 MAG: exodeoxyribonuclease III [Elusimicrobia bacterium GWC2_65_9]HAZ07570.1 exodeoxyribonuclease III [Elusimicrobiota bacterium]